LELKIKTENRNLDLRSETLPEPPQLNRIGIPVDQSMDNDVEPKNDRYLDPDYPSREILLELADKLLKLFEKR
jgi:hypothetical protein